MQPAGYSKTTVFLSNLFLVIAIAAVNSAVVTDITLLYLVPVLIVSWRVAAWAGIALSLISAFLWAIYDTSTGSLEVRPVFHAWQAAIRSVLFLTTAVMASRLKRELDRERRLSRSDELTGVSNRRDFYETLGTELDKLRRHRHPLTLMYIDVDDFKLINDRFGHDAGDEFLRLMASVLKGSTRPYDVTARLGGDEFAVLLPETDFARARQTARKLHKRLETARRRQYTVTFSIGSLTLVDAPVSADEAVRMADEIMYDVKRSGKNSTKAVLYELPINLPEAAKATPS